MKLVISGDNTYILSNTSSKFQEALKANVPERDRFWNYDERCWQVHTRHYEKVIRLLKMYGYTAIEEVYVYGLEELTRAMKR